MNPSSSSSQHPRVPATSALPNYQVAVPSSRSRDHRSHARASQSPPPAYSEHGHTQFTTAQLQATHGHSASNMRRSRSHGVPATPGIHNPAFGDRAQAHAPRQHHANPDPHNRFVRNDQGMTILWAGEQNAPTTRGLVRSQSRVSDEVERHRRGPRTGQQFTVDSGGQNVLSYTSPHYPDLVQQQRAAYQAAQFTAQQAQVAAQQTPAGARWSPSQGAHVLAPDQPLNPQLVQDQFLAQVQAQRQPRRAS